MSKNRRRQRANKRKYKPEEYLGGKNEYGINDPTPRIAIDNIVQEKKEKREEL